MNAAFIMAAETPADLLQRWQAVRATCCRYFASVLSPEEAGEAYRSLARQLHPDAGGDSDQFATMQHQYDIWRECYQAYITMRERMERYPGAFLDVRTARAQTPSLGRQLIRQVRETVLQPEIVTAGARWAGLVAQKAVKSVLSKSDDNTGH